MKRALTILFLMVLSVSLFGQAQHRTLISERDSITSLIDQALAKRDSSGKLPRGLRKITTNINLQLATSVNAKFSDNKFESGAFDVNMVRLEIHGRFTDRLSYNFRQSFNKSFTTNNTDKLSSHVEYALLTYHGNDDKFEITAGKQFVLLSGYEYYVNAIRVRDYSEFNNHVSGYETGITGQINFSPTQHLALQVVNNSMVNNGTPFAASIAPRYGVSKFPIMASLHWNGSFADNSIQLLYSASYSNIAQGENAFFLTCGNVYEKGPIVAYIDLLYTRQSVDLQGRISSLLGTPVRVSNVDYFTVIANLDYKFHPQWNAYIKGVYEIGNRYGDSSTNSDLPYGNFLTNWNAQACLEWFPIKNDNALKVFAHYSYKGNVPGAEAQRLGINNYPDLQKISLGLVYVIPVL